MTFHEAVIKLDEIAGKKYHSLKYDLTTGSDGTRRQSCSIYLIPDTGSGVWTRDCATWEQAFEELELAISGRLDKGQPEEAPI